MTDSDDAHMRWMALALEQAELAAAAGEVPVGAVVVCEGRVIAKAFNQTLQLADPTAHAEVLVLRAAAQELGNHRLNDCTLYVTLEPCAMCSGAVFQARLKTVVYGAPEPKTGAAGSVVDLFANPQLNHHTRIVGGVQAALSSQLLARFFAQRRAAAASSHAPQRLSEAALRTPARAFAALAPEGEYGNQWPASQGMRMHWLQQAAEAVPPLESKHEPEPTVWVLLHPLWHWSAWWQPLMRALREQGATSIAPDLLGWGRSDKPKRADWHTLERHVLSVFELLVSQGVTRCVLVCQDGSDVLARTLAAHSLSQAALGVAKLEVLAVVQLHCQETQGIWPAPPAQAAQKTWRVDAYLRAHLQTHLQAHQHRQKKNQQTRWQPVAPPTAEQIWQEAAAPYPDAGHARNWASRCFATPATEPFAGNMYQLDAHAQRDSIQLAQQLRIMAQAWRDADTPLAPSPMKRS